MKEEIKNDVLAAAKEALRKGTGSDYEVTMMIFGPGDPGILRVISTLKSNEAISFLLYKAFKEINVTPTDEPLPVIPIKELVLTGKGGSA